MTINREFIGREIKDGAIVVDETDYKRLRYRSALLLPQPFADKHREMQEHYKAIEQIERDIKKYVHEEFKPKHMPVGMNCVSVTVTRSEVVAEWESDKVSIVAIRREPPPQASLPKERCPYQDIANRMDFKQILSSGVLTKEEKRKCLGLPVAEHTDNNREG